ncbi:MAG: cobalamin B12-binding domain-containing protein [Nanoarchaeota archaeon]
MGGKCVIYLADLVHNYVSKGPFTFPINIGFISAYTKKIFGNDVEIKLFKFPLDLINEIKKQKPDVVGLSNYTWNLDLNEKMLDYIKSVSKDIITVLGGPDFPVEYADALKYIKQRKNLDFFVLYQGEIGFTNIIKFFF